MLSCLLRNMERISHLCVRIFLTRKILKKRFSNFDKGLLMSSQLLLEFSYLICTSQNKLLMKIISFLRKDASKILSTSNDNDKPYCLVFYDPCYRDAIQQYSTSSSRVIFSKIASEHPPDSSYFSLYGRTVHLPVPLDPSSYSVIFISHSKAALYNFALYFYAYDFR